MPTHLDSNQELSGFNRAFYRVTTTGRKVRAREGEIFQKLATRAHRIPPSSDLGRHLLGYPDSNWDSSGFGDHLPNRWLTPVVGPTGFEPALSRVTGGCFNQVKLRTDAPPTIPSVASTLPMLIQDSSLIRQVTHKTNATTTASRRATQSRRSTAG